MVPDTEHASRPGTSERAPELAQGLLEQGLTVRLPVTGRSMEPFISSGDTLVVEPVTAATALRFGDVVLVRGENHGCRVHRIVRIGCSQVVTRGDGRSGADPPCDPGSVRGRVTRIERGDPVAESRFGLGPERVLIAVLSRLGVLRRLRFLFRVQPTPSGTRASRTDSSGLK